MERGAAGGPSIEPATPEPEPAEAVATGPDTSLHGPMALAAGLSVFTGLLLKWFTVDDAAITYQFVRQWVGGHPLGTITSGQAVVAGYSNPTWTVGLAGFAKLGIAPDIAAKGMGFLFLAATAVLVVQLIGHLCRDRTWAWAGALVGVSYTLVFWSVSGLENSLIAFLVTALALLLVREEQRGAGLLGSWPSALVLAILVVSRPDAFAYLAVGFVAKAWSLHRRAGRPWPSVLRTTAGWAAPAVLSLGGLLAWTTHRFGHPLPNTVYAKVHLGFVERLEQLVDPRSDVVHAWAGYLWTHAGLALLPLVAIAAHRLWRTPARSVIVVLAGTAILPLSEADWMGDYRFFSTVVPLLLVAAVLGAEQLATASPVPGASDRTGRRVLVMILLVAWTVPNMLLITQVATHGNPRQVTFPIIEAKAVRLEEAGNRFGVDDPLLMLPDAGATTYVVGARMLDTAGLLDPQIAHLADRPTERLQYAFAEQRPDVVSTGGKWTRRWGMDWGTMRSLGYLPLRVFQDAEGQHGDWIRADLVQQPRTPGLPLATAAGTDLVQLATPTTAEPGGTIRVRAALAGRPDPSAETLRVRLVAPSGRIGTITEAPVGMGVLPPAGWPADQEILHVATLPVPTGAGAGTWHVELSLGDGSQWTTLTTEPITVTPHAAAPARTTGPATDQIRHLQDACLAIPSQAEACADRGTDLRREGAAAQAVAARDDLARGDELAVVHDVRLGADLRGRQEIDAGWRDLAADLLTRSKAHTSARSGYELAVAAQLADPDLPDVQEQLLAARHRYLVDHPADRRIATLDPPTTEQRWTAGG